MRALLRETLFLPAQVAHILLGGVRISLWKPVGVGEGESAATLGTLPRTDVYRGAGPRLPVWELCPSFLPWPVLLEHTFVCSGVRGPEEGS